MEVKVSLFSASIRPQWYDLFFKSLESTTVSYEVVFGGHCTPEEINPYLAKYPMLTYIFTAKIKPCQVYEACRRACAGELIHYTADDAEYSSDCIGKAYEYWKTFNDEKVILSIQTKENGQLCDMDLHSFQGSNLQTPLMAPLGMMSRAFLERLGGCDRRYICGQYENDIVMRAYKDGGRVFHFKDGVIELDHYKKHGPDHEGRSFAVGYNKDREILEKSWGTLGELLKTNRSDQFEPFEDKDLLTVSQCNLKGGLWV